MSRVAIVTDRMRGDDAMDAIELLADDHRHLHGLLVHWERMDAAGPERRRRLLDEIVRALVTHASIEERVLHPALLDLPGGPELAEVAAREHAEAEGAVARIERLDPGHPRVARGSVRKAGTGRRDPSSPGFLPDPGGYRSSEAPPHDPERRHPPCRGSPT